MKYTAAYIMPADFPLVLPFIDNTFILGKDDYRDTARYWSLLSGFVCLFWQLFFGIPPSMFFQ